MLSFRKVGSVCASIVLTFVGVASLSKDAFAQEWQWWNDDDEVGTYPVQATRRNYYVCRGETPNGWQAGHVNPNEGVCYVAWEDTSLGFHEFQVLQNAGNLVWASADLVVQDGLRPLRLDPEGDFDTLICKADGLPGKLVGGVNRGICYTSWQDYNIPHSTFSVLVYREDF